MKCERPQIQKEGLYQQERARYFKQAECLAQAWQKAGKTIREIHR